jgi:thiamine-phosphate pyrophosphorylase
MFRDGPAILMAIVGEGGAASAMEAIRGGADLVQVRAKHLGGRDLLALVRAVIEGGVDPSRVIVNSRPDIASVAGAGGVHLPEHGLAPAQARRAFPGLAIGVSRHDRDGLLRAELEGVDYALLGPIFETPGKETAAIGVVRIREQIDGLSVPVLGVGGIDDLNARSAIDAGLAGVAAIRAFATPDPEAVRRLRSALNYSSKAQLS